MNISQNGINFIKEAEGLYLKAYDDGAGVCTIGYGHTGCGVHYGQSITEEKAEQLLREDLQSCVNEVNANIKNGHMLFTPTQNMFDALVSFTFNCGGGSLFTLLNKRNSSQVADALLLYKNDCNGNFMQGLYNRRVRERELFLNGSTASTPIKIGNTDYEEHGNATVIVNSLNVRTEPSLSGEVVASYSEGETIYNYDHVYEADGYRWIRYLGASGNYRYVASRELSSNKRYLNCY